MSAFLVGRGSRKGRAMDKALCYGALGIGALMALVFLLDLISRHRAGGFDRLRPAWGWWWIESDHSHMAERDQHLRQPLTPPDHINTALSSGIGEIIEVAMAKNRDDRYSSTLDMLEDLKAVRAGQPPVHAHRAFDLDSLAKIEETGKTVDLAAYSGSTKMSELMNNPYVIALLSVAGISILFNIILLLMRH